MCIRDSNIHPIILYDDKDTEEVERVITAGREILTACVELGGSLTGEHGIGVEKIELMSTMFGSVEMEVMQSVRATFDARGLCNPGKILPMPGGCVEIKRPRPRGGG